MSVFSSNPAAAVGFLAAAAVGVASSLHCFLMCGPLACAGFSRSKGPKLASGAAYQGARIAAYVVVGAILGLLGGGVAQVLTVSVAPYLPWILALTLLATAFDVGRHLPSLPGIGKIAGAVARWSRGFSPTVRSAAIGALTPLLPCGLLYGLFVAALAAGSVSGGALVMGGFALGSAPALLLAQVQTGWLRKLPPAVAFGVQRAMPVLAAVVLVYRAVMVGDPGEGSCH